MPPHHSRPRDRTIAAARAASLTGGRPAFSGCTQIGAGGPLLRDYDHSPDECEGTSVSSHFLPAVIGMQEAGWGLLDGMNDAGLAVPVVLRYLLETCAITSAPPSR